ncbi:MAG: hypothetical protein ACRC5T_03225 [Cetobacterium sp.]
MKLKKIVLEMMLNEIKNAPISAYEANVIAEKAVKRFIRNSGEISIAKAWTALNLYNSGNEELFAELYRKYIVENKRIIDTKSYVEAGVIIIECMVDSIVVSNEKYKAVTSEDVNTAVERASLAVDKLVSALNK